jgi:hypothetical protein
MSCCTGDTTRRERAKKGGAPAVPITVRQLEAITRVSESLAKMCLQPHVTEEHVQEALRLFEAGGDLTPPRGQAPWARAKLTVPLF